jgi:hypothetical protein
MSEKLWDDPETYDPARFLDPRTGQFSKPEYFQVYTVYTKQFDPSNNWNWLLLLLLLMMMLMLS